ncbi:MAG: PIG-L family deacetylase [Sulfuritalea sp.]|nr:PIG-L family deacetylase [Sulfuritalea sp.]
MHHEGNVLVVAAHPDDEVLGCGGTIACLADAGRVVHVLLLADGESSRAAADGSGLAPSSVAVRNAAAEQACRILGCASVETLALPDNRLDELVLLDVVKQVEARIARHAPTTVLTHHGGDVNIDHRVAHEAVIVACRPTPGHAVRELLFFEVPSSTEWRPPASGNSFMPNYFVDVSAVLDRKIAALNAYASELRPFPHPRSLTAVEALARWRGATAGVSAAEAFMLGRKIVTTG